MTLVLPPNEVFITPPAPLVQTQGGYGTYGWIRDVCPEEGGLFAYYVSEPYPRKGHTYPEAVEANNIIKRLTIGNLVSLASKEAIVPGIGFLLLPWKWKIQWVEKILSNYCRMADYVNRNHYMKRRFYNQFSKELWDIIYVFLKHVGISSDIAYRCGRIVAHMLEHEDAYRARIQDIITESSKEALLQNSRKEITRLVAIYISREKEGIHDKFLSIPKIVSILLFVPRLKRIFNQTIAETNISLLQYDEIDRYYILNRDGYNFLGRDIEDRFEEYRTIHNEHIFRNLNKEITDPVVLEKVKQQLMTLGIT